MPDVRVGDWAMPWNARDGVGRLAAGIPKSDFWASAYVKSTYRVLLTRGPRGCYVYSMDVPTRDFFLRRTERHEQQSMVAESAATYGMTGG